MKPRLLLNKIASRQRYPFRVRNADIIPYDRVLVVLGRSSGKDKTSFRYRYEDETSVREVSDASQSWKYVGSKPHADIHAADIKPFLYKKTPYVWDAYFSCFWRLTLNGRDAIRSNSPLFKALQRKASK